MIQNNSDKPQRLEELRSTRLHLIDNFPRLFSDLDILDTYLSKLEDDDIQNDYTIEHIVMRDALNSLKANLEHYQTELKCVD